MFFDGNRIDAMREMILAENLEDRKKALAKLLPYQRDDFAGIFRELKGFPTIIRTLDPPLHEFLPHEDDAQQDLAKKMGVPVEKIKQRVKELHEFNPMLGLRGCRLGIVYPEITEMQSRAVIEAAVEVQKEGIKVKPEIMIVLVGFPKEFQNQLEVVHRVAEQVHAEQKTKIKYHVGTMIEIPRGALAADEIAKDAEFFSFGTNDLTQTCLGMSRDDSGPFLGPYQETEIIKKNPFASIDQGGVGQLMKIAVERGRSTRPDLKLGICGEHGGDPDSVKFCHRIGLDLRELLALPRPGGAVGGRPGRPRSRRKSQPGKESRRRQESGQRQTPLSTSRFGPGIDSKPPRESEAAFSKSVTHSPEQQLGSRSVLECGSPLPLSGAGDYRKRQRTAALQDASRPQLPPEKLPGAPGAHLDIITIRTGEPECARPRAQQRPPRQHL